MTSAQRKAELDEKSTTAAKEISVLGQLLNTSPGTMRKILQAQFDELPLDHLIDTKLLPLIIALDHGWSNNHISIAQEHLISDILVSLLSQHINQHQPQQPQARLLFLTINGERHKLGFTCLRRCFKVVASFVP